jgi:hypothetical protein
MRLRDWLDTLAFIILRFVGHGAVGQEIAQDEACTTA